MKRRMGRLTTDETDLETVKSVLTDPKHNVVLVVRLESSNDLKKRYDKTKVIFKVRYSGCAPM